MYSTLFNFKGLNFMNIYDYTLPKPNGEELKLSEFKGKVMMIVNTATGCGFTPQYEAIESLYEKYHDKGLEIIDIPCDQFGHQAPGTDEEIHEFCQIHYNNKKVYHCKYCNVCIEGLDHHCIWIGKCVGRGNIYTFYIMLLAIVIFYSYMLGITFFSLMQKK